MLLRRSAVVMIAVLIAFVFAAPLHLQAATIALAGAAVLMLLDNWKHRGVKQADNVRSTFAEVDWTTIFFSSACSSVVHAVEVSGAPLSICGHELTGGADRRPHARRGRRSSSGCRLFFSAVGSTTFPFVATMIPLIKGMTGAYGGPHEIEPLWWCLSLGACLGGNGTLTGASANLTIAGIAERNGIRFGFVQYLVYAVPMTLVSIVICQLYLWLRYF